MTMTPLATIADALIDFILSLLRDPAAAEEFAEDPEGSMDRAGLGGCSVADVRAVAPVIYDHPDVAARPPQTVYVPTKPQPADPVERAIQNIVNNFSYDHRATVVDQSVNQNIWAEGDVNQIFDQSAVVNTGDQGVAAGRDVAVDNSTTDVGGDVNIGNTTTDTTVTDSFNDNSTTTETTTDTSVDDSFNTDSEVASTDTVVVEAEDDAPEVASYDVAQEAPVEDAADASTPTVDEAPEDPFVDDQP